MALVKARTEWVRKMRFESRLGEHMLAMDAKAPLGEDSAPTPKQVLMSAIAGCTAMDVVSYLKKLKQEPTAFAVENESEQTSRMPSVFERVQLKFILDGDMDPAAVLESVRLSMTKFCGVSAMISRVSPLSYVVYLNGQELGRGDADFDESLGK